MSAPSLELMTQLLTTPYRRGAETLDLALGAEADGRAEFAPYDFEEYGARYGAEPRAVRYVLFARAGGGREPFAVEVEYGFGDGRGVASVEVAAGTPAGASFVIPLPAEADSSLRLLRLRRVPAGGAGADSFRVVALLGNLAKLAWVLGCEKDEIREHLRVVKRQREVARAAGTSLDRLGDDLGVPRFPAREYSFDEQTLALYHFNDAPADGGEVADAMKAFGRAGHPGTNRGATPGVKGRFGSGFRFPGPAGSGAVSVPNHDDFNFTAERSFTVEAFVKSDAVEDAARPPRALVAKMDPGGDGEAPPGTGWSLTLGHFRGIANNPRWSLADGTTRVDIYADVNVADGRFHHLAGALDRAAARARLFVDGEERAGADVGGLALGSLVNGEDVQMGRGDGEQFHGIIDEVRFSNVARSSFHPALGEGDEEYRRRLRVFGRWLLPSPDTVAAAVNELVTVGGVTPSFAVHEQDNELVLTRRRVRILPVSMRRGACISAEGDVRTTEREAAGAPEDEPEFDPAWLVTHDDAARVSYGASPDNQRMQRAVAEALDRLSERVGAEQGVAGKLVVQRAYDPSAADLHRLGRSLLVTHTNASLRPERLAALAHAAGFDYVCHERSGSIKVSARKAEPLEIVLPHRPTQLPDLSEGGQLALSVRPAPPQDAEVRWVVVQRGGGRGRIEGAGATVTFTGEAAGNLLVRVEVTRKRRTAVGTRLLRVGLRGLAAGESISGEGQRGVSEEQAAGPRSPFFDPAYLTTFQEGESPSRMQPHAALLLLRLRALLPEGGTLDILEAYTPDAESLHGEGRALRLAHEVLSPSELAPRAFAAGFDYIKHGSDPPHLRVATARADLLSIESPRDEVEVGESLNLSLAPWNFPSEPPERVQWVGIPSPHGELEFSSKTMPATVVTARAPGTVEVRAAHVRGGEVMPYQYELRLVPALDRPETVISKEQYDIILNVLHNLRPVGAGVLTGRIREHVVEVRTGAHDAFPGYTYIRFKS
jgi:hypothetical protein